MPPKGKPVPVAGKKTAAATTSKKTTTTSNKAASSSKKAVPTAKSTKDVTDKMANLSTADPPKPVVIDIELKDLANVLKDDDGKIKATGKWPLIVDGGGRATVFLRYQGGNTLDALSPTDMEPESIRKRLIGSIRFGHNFVLDFGDSDMFTACQNIFDKITKGLMGDILDKSILEKYEYLIKDEDGPEYEKDKFLPLYIGNFQFIVLSKIDPGQDLRDKFCIIKIKE